MSDQERGLCPAAKPGGKDGYNCEFKEGRSCPSFSARNYIGCTIWAGRQTSQEKAPAGGCEIIDLQSRRRVMLTSKDGLESISAAWTKIAAGIQDLFIAWLHGPEGQAALTAIIAQAFKGQEEEQ